MTLYGWDASDFDHSRGPMDMAAAAAAGISFFTHKFTEGNSTRHHPAAAMNAARAAGIPYLGAYLVPRTPGPSIAVQVSYLLAWADSQTPWWRTFPGWFWQVDTERWSYDHVSAATGAAACAELRRRTGRAVLHYAPQWAYADSIPGTDPLWASRYVTGSGDMKALAAKIPASSWVAYSGRTPAILQFSSKATIGRQSGCDANLFRGGLDDFARLIGGGTPAPPPAQQEDDMPALIKWTESPAVFLTTGLTAKWLSEQDLADHQTLHAEGTLPLGFGGKVREVGNRQLIGFIVGDCPSELASQRLSTGSLTDDQVIAVVADLKAALAGDAVLTGEEVEQAVARALAAVRLSTTIGPA